MNVDALDKLNAKQRILLGALQLFMQKGVDGTSIDDIVTIASVSRGGLYHHFGSKVGLFEAVLEQYFLRGFSEFDQVIFAELSYTAQRSTLIDMLAELFLSIARQYGVDKTRYFALFFDSLARSPSFRTAIQRHYTDLEAAMSAKAPSATDAKSFVCQLEGEIYFATIFDRSPDFTAFDPRKE